MPKKQIISLYLDAEVVKKLKRQRDKSASLFVNDTLREVFELNVSAETRQIEDRFKLLFDFKDKMTQHMRTQGVEL